MLTHRVAVLLRQSCERARTQHVPHACARSLVGTFAPAQPQWRRHSFPSTRWGSARLSAQECRGVRATFWISASLCASILEVASGLPCACVRVVSMPIRNSPCSSCSAAPSRRPTAARGARMRHRASRYGVASIPCDTCTQHHPEPARRGPSAGAHRAQHHWVRRCPPAARLSSYSGLHERMRSVEGCACSCTVTVATKANWRPCGHHKSRHVMRGERHRHYSHYNP